MNRVERLTGILLALQGGRFTADQLAVRFELSRRTILRDMDALSQMGVPIVAIAGPGGGYRLPDDFWLAPLNLRLEEATAILLALRQMGDPATSPLGAAHASAVDKIRALLRPAMRDGVDAELAAIEVQHGPAAESSTLATLRSALRAGQWCALTYVSPRETTERDVLPRRIVLAEGRWYVHAIDALRKADRAFRIDRITKARTIAAPVNAGRLVADIAAERRPYDHVDHPLVEVELNSTGTARCREHPDFRDRLAETSGVGRLTFRCPPDELAYYARELLTLGTDAVVLGPPELVQAMREHIDRIAAHLRNA